MAAAAVYGASGSGGSYIEWGRWQQLYAGKWKHAVVEDIHFLDSAVGCALDLQDLQDLQDASANLANQMPRPAVSECRGRNLKDLVQDPPSLPPP